LFYFTTFAIGGGLIAVHFLLQNPIGLSEGGLLTFNSGYGDPISIIFILVGFPIIWLFTKRRMDKHAVEKIRYDEMCPVSIQINHTTYSTIGYIDSGNQLVDPISKHPVSICDEQFLKQWFSKDEWQGLEKAHRELNFNKIPAVWEKRIRLIPYQGVEGKSNFLLALKPDKLIVYYGQEKIVTRKVLIGIQFARLTKDEAYHCLLQPQIIKIASVASA
jgi:stage II sporulation protein GA (sporulation sigma-E factor processing peptidase)